MNVLSILLLKMQKLKIKKMLTIVQEGSKRSERNWGVLEFKYNLDVLSRTRQVYNLFQDLLTQS